MADVETDQQRLDLDAAAIAETFVNIKLEINRLENAAVAGQPLDFAQLEKALQSGKDIVAAAPPAADPTSGPVVQPVQTPASAGGASDAPIEPAPEPAVVNPEPAENPSPEPAPAA